jgi:hypothetical protein
MMSAPLSLYSQPTHRVKRCSASLLCKKCANPSAHLHQVVCLFKGGCKRTLALRQIPATAKSLALGPELGTCFCFHCESLTAAPMSFRQHRPGYCHCAYTYRTVFCPAWMHVLPHARHWHMDYATKRQNLGTKRNGYQRHAA